ncbi:MAG TPA: sodium:solute symporter family protein [Opitutaceae bacterium]|jgi:Na+/proline symporter|nr:sodium:solute symporter family protein [Opitutaceae bacterium]
MQLHPLDLGIIAAYFLLVVVIGLRVSRRGGRNLDSYFLGGKAMPWWVLGVSDASGMFDISGTMWLVYVLFLYGLKSIWLPWVWPTFNQIFLMVFMSAWLRRSNVLTGAEWIRTRFGDDRGGILAHLSVVAFALINVVGLLAYAFKGIGKFAAVLLPWHLSHATSGPFTNENLYAIILLGITSIYAIKGGMVSVVVTEVAQFTILTLSAFAIGAIAMFRVSPAMIASRIPAGWMNPFFGWKLHLDWSAILPAANSALRQDGNEFFTIIFGLMFFKGVLASLAGPAPTYDMQRILATRNAREASLMNGMVTVVLMFPRYLMIAGITVLALAFCLPELQAQGSPDLEKILPLVLSRQIPAGVLGFLLAGLAAAFMSNFAATLNAAPAYVVNDIYKRFINDRAGDRREIALSRAVSFLFLVVGVVLGLFTDRITTVMMWLVGALYGGFVAANVLKWYWWRFNGYGYFWGMVAGIGGAIPMVVPQFAQAILGHSVNLLYAFPVLLVLSVAGCLAGTLLTEPVDPETLKHFYRTVRPWGWWGPVCKAVQREDPAFVPNRNAGRDLTNVAVGIVWQLCLVTLPIYLVLRQWTWSAGIFVLLAGTCAWLKFRWYDRLEKA